MVGVADIVGIDIPGIFMAGIADIAGIAGFGGSC
jgi:hypothetical protein